MATRYVDNMMVIGADLRNELRGHLDPITNETIPVTWGFGEPERDWQIAAEEAGRTVLEANPNMLVIVEGILSGEEITAAAITPVHLPIHERLVYSGHMDTTSRLSSNVPWNIFKEIMFVAQTFVRVPGHAYSTAYILGESDEVHDIEVSIGE